MSGNGSNRNWRNNSAGRQYAGKTDLSWRNNSTGQQYADKPVTVALPQEPVPISDSAKMHVSALVEKWSETQSDEKCIPKHGITTASQFQQYVYNYVLKPGSNGIDLKQLYACLTYYFETYPIRTETTHASCFSPHTSALYAKHDGYGKITDVNLDSVLKAFLMLSSFGISPWTRNSYGEDGFQSAVQATIDRKGTITSEQLDKVMAAFAYVTPKIVESICRRHFNKLTSVPEKSSDTYKELLRCFVAHPKEFMMMVCEALGFVQEPKLAAIRERHWLLDLLNELMTDVVNNFNGYSNFFKSTLFNNVAIDAKQCNVTVPQYCMKLMFLAIDYLLNAHVKGDTEDLRIKKQDRRYLIIFGVVASLIGTNKFDEYLVKTLYPQIVDLSKQYAITKTQQTRIAYIIAMMYQNRKQETPTELLDPMKLVIVDTRVELSLRSSIRVMLNLGDVPVTPVVQVKPEEDDKTPVPMINPRKEGYLERLRTALSSPKLQDAIFTAVYDLAITRVQDQEILTKIVAFLIQNGFGERLHEWFRESVEYNDNVALFVMSHVNHAVKN